MRMNTFYRYNQIQFVACLRCGVKGRKGTGRRGVGGARQGPGAWTTGRALHFAPDIAAAGNTWAPSRGGHYVLSGSCFSAGSGPSLVRVSCGSSSVTSSFSIAVWAEPRSDNLPSPPCTWRGRGMWPGLPVWVWNTWLTRGARDLVEATPAL